MTEEKGGSVFIGGIILAFKLVWTALVILTPVLAIWFASSLAAYLNGPVWALVLSGALLFPVLPLMWDFWGSHRFRKKQEKRREKGKDARSRILTFWDRLILRTLAISLAFLGVLMVAYPQTGFTAVSTRGDWMLDHFEQTYEVEPIRTVLFDTAEKLEWLHEAARENPYEQYAEEDGDTPVPTPSPNEFGDQDDRKPSEFDEDTDATADSTQGDDEAGTSDTKPGGGDGDSGKRPTEDGEDDSKNRDIEIVGISDDDPDSAGSGESGEGGSPESIWPMKQELHPVVAGLPKSVETDYESVARYIGEREKDPFLRVKALHDYVADRIVYDVQALRTGSFPPQDATSVFKSQKAVCAGYSKLLMAMGKATGDEIIYVVGVSRDMGGEVSGAGHAWNAAKIKGKWYLIDATWNAGTVEDGVGFKKQYRTEYLFTPPDIFGMNHFPEDESWQLRKDALSRGEFMRQPVLQPAFFKNRLKLIEPNRSQITASDDVEIVIENPYGRRLLASIVDKKDGNSQRCKIRGRSEMKIQCDIPRSGTYQVRIFAGGHGQLSYPFVGQIEVVGS